MAVTNNIREIREQRGIYQDDLAAAIGYNTKTVGGIERGDSTPSAEFMLRISKYFNMLAQHATATCCRECIRKWHKMQPGRKLSQVQQDYLVDVIMTWIQKEMDKHLL